MVENVAEKVDENQSKIRKKGDSKIDRINRKKSGHKTD